MKYLKLLITLIVLALCGALLYSFTKKHYIEILGEEVFSRPPADYCSISIIHNQEELDRLVKYWKGHSIDIDKSDWNFDLYSYVISEGQSVKSMHYSDKETMIDDNSPVYCKIWKKGMNLLRTEYTDTVYDKVVVYTIPKDESISTEDGV